MASPSPKPTYALLLADSESWEELWALFHSPVWATVEKLLLAERQLHLESLLSNPSPNETQEDHMARHLTIARWLQEFTSGDSGIRARLLEDRRRGLKGDYGAESTQNDYMAQDSGTR